MTDTVTIALITGGTTLVGLVINRVLSHRENKGTENKITEVHVLINNRMDQLLAAARQEERLAGHAEGLAEGRQLSISERQDRVAEVERVEDRADKKIGQQTIT